MKSDDSTVQGVFLFEIKEAIRMVEGESFDGKGLLKQTSSKGMRKILKLFYEA